MLQGDAPALTEHADKLAQFQRALFADLRNTFQVLQHQDDTHAIANRGFAAGVA